MTKARRREAIHVRIFVPSWFLKSRSGGLLFLHGIFGRGRSRAGREGGDDAALEGVLDRGFEFFERRLDGRPGHGRFVLQIFGFAVDSELAMFMVVPAGHVLVLSLTRGPPCFPPLWLSDIKPRGPAFELVSQ